AVPTLALGTDAFLAGLARLAGATAGALPAELGSSVAEAAAGRAALLVELGALAPGESWTLAAALAEADRRFIAPALAALQGGAPGLLPLLATDRCVVPTRGPRLRFWRRAHPGLAALA